MPRTRAWHGCVTNHRGILYVRVKDHTGKWIDRSLKLTDTPSNRRTAERRLREIREQILGDAPIDIEPGAPTCESWAKRWIEERRRSGVSDASSDEGRLREHILPKIGGLLLSEVRPRHLLDIVESMKAVGRAPRTVRNVYYVAKAMFRDAEIAELLPLGRSPCILTKRQLGKLRDAKTGWRATAVFTRAEIEQLISEQRIPEDRRVWYALLTIAMLRTGEAAGLRFRAIQMDVQPLGKLHVATSYDHGTTKTDTERWVPIHPTLARIVEHWKTAGWAATFGREPTPDDIVVPVVEETRKGRKRAVGSMRDKNYAWKRLASDLRTLELRHRRAHDLRRTGISLAKDDGAEESKLAWATHAPPRHVMGLYTTHQWSALCAEIAKLRVEIRPSSTHPEDAPFKGA